MTIHVSATTGCNLGCSYCYENPDRERKQEWVDRQYDMDKIMERLEEWKEQYPGVRPGMHGGEPLLVRKDDLETIFSWIDEHYDGQSHIQTNATLLDEDHVEMFEEYNVHVGVSCDGPAELNSLRKAAGERGTASEKATNKMTERTHDAIEKLVESDAGCGIIIVLSEANAGDGEKLEVLLDWMDYLNENGVYGHFNPAIPYEDVQTDVSLDSERLKEVYLRAWEWMKEEPYRRWGPMDNYVDNLLGNQVSNCVNNKCFDEETEILTEDGWKRFPDVTDERVATVNQDTGELEFQKPTHRQEYEYSGDMLYFHSNAYDMMVTPDHGMYVESSKGQGFEKEPATRTAERSQRARFKRAPDGWSGESSDFFELEPATEKAPSNGSLLTLERVDMHSWAEFVGWYIAEGSSGIYGDNRDHRVTISQRDEENRERIIELLDSMGFNPRVDGDDVRVTSKQLYNYVKDFGYSHEKYVPEYIKSASTETIERFVDAAWLGDGSGHCYYTTSKELADDMQELLAKLGTSANIRTDDRSGPDGNWKKRYIVSRGDSRKTPHLTGDVDRIEYDGMVYDFTVPNGTLYVRRNGLPVVSGNCDVGNAGAAQIIKGNGETTSCGKTWSAYGDGGAFLAGDSTGNRYDDDESRYDMLKATPGPETDGAPDMGGCKGCKYWNVCTGGCPSAGMNDDFRNRTVWCEAKFALYEKVEEDLRAILPNITLITDYPWDAQFNDVASSWDLDIKPFAAMRPDTQGKSSAWKGYTHQYGGPEERIPEDMMPDMSWEEKKDRYTSEYDEDEVVVDDENHVIHVDSDMAEDSAGWEEVDDD